MTEISEEEIWEIFVKEIVDIWAEEMWEDLGLGDVGRSREKHDGDLG